MLGEQRLKVLGHLGHLRRRHADVLDDQRRPGRPHLADQPVHPLAHLPVDLDRFRVAVKVRLADQLAAREHLRRARLRGRQLGLVLAAELDQKGGRERVDLLPVLGGAADVVRRDDQRRRDHQLDRPRPGGDEVPDRLEGRVDVREVQPGEGRAARLGERLEHGLGDEPERALGADQQPAEDLERGLGVEEGAQPVAGRVLDRELAPDPLAELGVVDDLLADLREAGRELGLGVREAALGVGGGGVDHRAGGEHEGQLADGLVRVAGHSAAHPAGVVGDHAADAGDVGRGRVGTEFVSVRGEHPVDVAEQRPRLHPGAGAAVLDLNPAEVAPDVDQDPVGLPLSVEAGASGTEDHGDRVVPAVGDHLRDVGGVVGDDDRLREQPVRARVGGVANDVGGAGEDALGANQPDQLAAQRLRRPGRDPVRGGVGARRGRLGRQRLDLGLEQGDQRPLPRTATSRAPPRPRPAPAGSPRPLPRAHRGARRPCSP